MSKLEPMSEHHCFALSVPSLEAIESSGKVVTEHSLLHRMHTILRLKAGDRCILFDDEYHILCTIKEISSKRVVCELGSKTPHKQVHPPIEWLLPLLKREAFEEALYSLTEMGATSIQPLYTAKTARSWGSEKEYTRARAVMRAAAEQSKQFVVPIIYPVKDIKELTSTGNSMRIFFDAEGMHLKEVLTQMGNPASFIGCVGPEGDLTHEEKQHLKDLGFVFCALTPTVLRSKQAIALGIGLLRSYYRAA